jgi:hypothetical protein
MMKKRILQRVLLGIITLWLVSVLIFIGTEMLPGDVATAILGQSATPETVAALRLQLGLDEPSVLRYLHWLTGIMHGDLGHSLANGRQISDELLPRLGNTLFLAGYAAVIAIPLAVGLGIASAIWRGSVFDRLANTLTLISISVPEFFRRLHSGDCLRHPSDLVSQSGDGGQFFDPGRPAVCLHPADAHPDAGGAGAYVAHDPRLSHGGDVQPVH